MFFICIGVYACWFVSCLAFFNNSCIQTFESEIWGSFIFSLLLCQYFIWFPYPFLRAMEPVIIHKSLVYYESILSNFAHLYLGSLLSFVKSRAFSNYASIPFENVRIDEVLECVVIFRNVCSFSYFSHRFMHLLHKSSTAYLWLYLHL